MCPEIADIKLSNFEHGQRGRSSFYTQLFTFSILLTLQ